MKKTSGEASVFKYHLLYQDQPLYNQKEPGFREDTQRLRTDLHATVWPPATPSQTWPNNYEEKYLHAGG